MYNESKIKQKRRAYLFPILVFTGFVLSTTFVHTAFAAEGTPGCGMFEIRSGCELGGWLHLILGDVAIGALLAVFLHFLAHRSNLKLEHNAKTIQSIIEMQEIQRNRRKDFAVFNLKNLFNHLLHVEGQVNKSVLIFNTNLVRESNRDRREWKRRVLVDEIHGEELRVARIINSIRNNLLAANDVLEPDVVNQIEGICTYLSELYAIERLDGVMTLPKYNISKKKIWYMIEMLDSYRVESHLFYQKKDHFNTSKIESTNNKNLKPISEEVLV